MTPFGLASAHSSILGHGLGSDEVVMRIKVVVVVIVCDVRVTILALSIILVLDIVYLFSS